eukprot:5215602-Alexandrium_andersonii.AAC.1
MTRPCGGGVPACQRGRPCARRLPRARQPSHRRQRGALRGSPGPASERPERARTWSACPSRGS